MTQPGGVGYVTGDARALPLCEVWTLLMHDGTDNESNLCVAEWTSVWHYAGACSGRRRW